MTHAELVDLARTWLAKRCPVVITEMTSGAWEEPDAIGWRGAGSILVECKVSRADLRADKDKPHRRRESVSDGLSWPGLGDERYYLFPDGLVGLDDPLLLPDWGVLYAGPKGKVRMGRTATWRNGDARSERQLLVSCLRRLGVSSSGGCSVKIYTIETKRRASLTTRKAKGDDDVEICEACPAKATKYDVDGVPLCEKCYGECAAAGEI